MYDLVIIGGGPAGASAGVYAARKQMKAVLVTEIFGGQSVVSSDIQNWIGEPHISGVELAKKFKGHLKTYPNLEVLEGDLVVKIEKVEEGYKATTKAGKVLETKTILIGTGARRRKLGVSGEAEFDGRGVAYCSTCDAPLFAGREVIVVGGGNAGLEAVLDLESYVKKIYLMVSRDSLRGDEITRKKVEASEKVQPLMLNTQITEIIGETMVTGVKYKDESGAKEMAIGGVFVEIGMIPNSDILEGMVELNKMGQIVVDHKTQKTSAEGIWAVGDVSDGLYQQNNISAGDAVKAVMNIQEYLQKRPNDK